MHRQCALITFARDADADARDRVAGRLAHTAQTDGAVVHHRIAAATTGGANGGDLVWHVHFRDRAGWAASAARRLPAALACDPAVDHVDSCAYRPTGVRLRDPAIGPAVYRALFLSVRPGAGGDRIGRFEADVAAMPDYIPEIRNWALSRVDEAQGARGWTHVWEQEFHSIEDLRGPYMASPYHWGHVDRWFDPEHHDAIVDPWLCHSASTLDRSVIALYAGAAAAR